MARRRQRYDEEALYGPAPKPPGVLSQIGGMAASGLSRAANVLDIPGSMARDTIAGLNTGNWSKYNPLDQLMTPTREVNRTTGRDLNRMLGFAGNKDTYGNWWGGLGTEILADPLTYVGGLGVAKSVVGKVAGKAGIGGLSAAQIATKAARAGKLSSAGTDAYRAGKASKYWDWVGPREANQSLTPDLIKEFAPEQFKTFENIAQNQKTPFDLAGSMDKPLGSLTSFWPLGDAGLIGTGKTGKGIARGLDVAGELFRNTKIPGTGIRPVADMVNLVNRKSGGAVTPDDLQAAYAMHGKKEGGRYEHRLLTAKWANDLERIGHKKTDALDVRDWFEFPDKAPAEARPLVDEVRQYLDRLPQMAQELGVKIGDVTEKMRWAGSNADYYMRYMAEGITGNKGSQSFGKLFDPAAKAEFHRLDFLHGVRGGTKAIAEMASDPEVIALKAANAALPPKEADAAMEALIRQKFGLKFDNAGNEVASGIDPATGQQIYSELPEHYLDSEQLAKLQAEGIEPTVENARKYMEQLKGTRRDDFLALRDVLASKGNLNRREADATARLWKAYSEGYLGVGLGKMMKEMFHGKGFQFNRQPGQDGKALISTFHSSDVSTHVHEMSHFMRRNLKVEDQKIADAFVGATGGQWTKQQEETFARGFERYLTEGVAPNKNVEGLFSRLKKFMVGIYQQITGSQIDVQLTPEIKALYGKLVGGPPPGGAKKYGQFAPQNSALAVAKKIRDMSPELLKKGIYANHPLNDFAAAMSGTMDKVVASKVALERIAESATLPGEGTVPIPSALKALDLEFGDGSTKGAVKWLVDHGVADPQNMHLPAETAEFLKQVGKGWTGGPKEVHAAVELFDNFSNVMKAVFTNLDPVRFNVRNRMSGLFANWIAGLDGILSGNSRDVRGMMSNMAIQGASQNPHLQRMAAERGIASLDDKRATEMLGEIMYALEAGGSYGVAEAHHHADDIGGKLSDIYEQIPGKTPFAWGDVAEQLKGGLGKSGTSWNPFSAWRGVGGAEKSKFAPLVAGEQISHLTESLNRMAPVWAQIQDGADPVEAARRVMEAQVDYRSRNYTSFEQQVLKRLWLFYSFSKGQFPFTINQLMDKPGGPLAQSLRAINAGRSEDDLTPQHVAETAAVPVGNLPFMQPVERGAKRYVTGLGLGFEDPAQFLGGPQSAGLEAISRMNPLWKAPLESAFGASTFQRAPGGGPRELRDMDPALGRTLANILELATGEKRKAPVRYPGSDFLEHMLSNLPTSNLLTKARTLTDPRKGAVVKGMNLLTGIKATDVSPASQDAELRNRIHELEKQMGGRTFERTYMPEEAKSRLSPEQAMSYARMVELEKLLGERSKARKDKKK